VSDPIRQELNRKLRVIIFSFAAIGAVLPFLFYGFGLSKYGSFIGERLVSLMFILCPPYIGIMGFEDMSAKGRVESVAMFAVVNALLYSIVGLFVGIVRLQKSFARLKNGSVKR
jgi:hypothetical protein